MKVFISADMEGTAGIACWPETERDKPEYPEFQALMTAEVVAACEGALEAGATEILIKDALHTGRNLLVDRLPPEVTEDYRKELLALQQRSRALIGDLAQADRLRRERGSE